MRSPWKEPLLVIVLFASGVLQSKLSSCRP